MANVDSVALCAPDAQWLTGHYQEWSGYGDVHRDARALIIIHVYMYSAVKYKLRNSNDLPRGSRTAASV